MKATFVKLTVEMKANPGKFQELHQTLEAFLPMIRGQKGCRDCRLSRDIEDGEVLTLAVDWGGREDLEQYVRSGSGGALLGAVELLSETSRVAIGRDLSWEGIETLKKMRRKAEEIER